MIGIEKEDLTIKSKESFKEEGRNEAVVNLRYNYYVKRYNTTVKSLMSEHKKIMRKSKYIDFRPQTTNSPSTPHHTNNMFGKLTTIKVNS